MPTTSSSRPPSRGWIFQQPPTSIFLLRPLTLPDFPQILFLSLVLPTTFTGQAIPRSALFQDPRKQTSRSARKGPTARGAVGIGGQVLEGWHPSLYYLSVSDSTKVQDSNFCSSVVRLSFGKVYCCWESGSKCRHGYGKREALVKPIQGRQPHDNGLTRLD